MSLLQRIERLEHMTATMLGAEAETEDFFEKIKQNPNIRFLWRQNNEILQGVCAIQIQANEPNPNVLQENTIIVTINNKHKLWEVQVYWNGRSGWYFPETFKDKSLIENLVFLSNLNNYTQFSDDVGLFQTIGKLSFKAGAESKLQTLRIQPPILQGLKLSLATNIQRNNLLLMTDQ